MISTRYVRRPFIRSLANTMARSRPRANVHGDRERGERHRPDEHRDERVAQRRVGEQLLVVVEPDPDRPARVERGGVGVGVGEPALDGLVLDPVRRIDHHVAIAVVLEPLLELGRLGQAGELDEPGVGRHRERVLLVLRQVVLLDDGQRRGTVVAGHRAALVRLHLVRVGRLQRAALSREVRTAGIREEEVELPVRRLHDVGAIARRVRQRLHRVPSIWAIACGFVIR